MPSPELAVQWQRAVLWPALGPDRHSQMTVGPGVEIAVRWNSNRSEALSPDGTTVSLDASVICVQRILIESRLWLGKLADLPAGSFDFSTVAEELMVAVTQNTVPDIKNRFKFFGAGLKRWKSVNR